jgi:hypothetical protein
VIILRAVSDAPLRCCLCGRRWNLLAGVAVGIVEATRRSGSDCGGGLCGPDLCSMPPCSGQSRPSPGGREDAASLDRPCARRLRDLAVGTDSPPFCKCFFALPSRFFSEVGHPDRSSMLAQPTAPKRGVLGRIFADGILPPWVNRGPPARAPLRQLSGHAAVRAGPPC